MFLTLLKFSNASAEASVGDQAPTAQSIAQQNTRQDELATSVFNFLGQLNKIEHNHCLSLAQMAEDMRLPGAPVLPSFLQRALNEDYPDQLMLAKQNTQDNTHIAEAVSELFSNLSEASEHATFMRALSQQKDQQAAVSYLFRAQRDADYKTVDLQVDGQHTPFQLYNYRPAPYLILLQQAQRYPLLNLLLENIQRHFQAQGIQVGFAKVQANTQGIDDTNPLRNSWGVFEDTQGYQMVGYFDEKGLLDGPGMVCHVAQGSVLTGENFKAGLLEGLGVFVGSNIRFYGQYLGGRGNGIGLVSSALGETVSIGPVIEGQLQLLTRLDQDNDSQHSEMATIHPDTGAQICDKLTYEIGDYVDGTMDLTAQFEHHPSRVADIGKALGLNFIPPEYRALNKKRGKNVSPFHVLALPCGVYIGTRQTKIALIHEWTHQNGRTRQEPLRTPTLVSTRLTRAVATLNEKDKAKKGIKS